LPSPEDNEPPEEEPPSPEDNQDEKKTLRKQAIRTLIQRSRKKNEIFESSFFVNNVSNHIDNLSKILRVYLYRLRSHQLARFVREEGIFNKKDWDTRLADRLSEYIPQL